MKVTSPSIRSEHHRAGFTLLEMTIVSTFMAFLALLIASTWSAFIRPTSDMAARSRVAQEASLAVSSLSVDLAGSFAGNRTGSKANNQFIGRMQPDNTRLRLCYDGGDSPNGTADWDAPDYVVSYYVDSNSLIRWDETSGTTFTVARGVSDFEITDQGGGQFQIKLTVEYRNTSNTYTIVARDP